MTHIILELDKGMKVDFPDHCGQLWYETIQIDSLFESKKLRKTNSYFYLLNMHSPGLSDGHMT